MFAKNDNVKRGFVNFERFPKKNWPCRQRKMSCIHRWKPGQKYLGFDKLTTTRSLFLHEYEHHFFAKGQLCSFGHLDRRRLLAKIGNIDIFFFKAFLNCFLFFSHGLFQLLKVSESADAEFGANRYLGYIFQRWQWD